MRQIKSKCIVYRGVRRSETCNFSCKTLILVMLLNFNAKKLFSYDAENSSEDLSQKYARIVDGLMSLPLNIPGTKYHESKKEQEKMLAMLREVLEKRRSTSQNDRINEGDFLDQMIKDLDKEKFLNEDLVAHLIYGILLANSESVATLVALAFILLSEHPSVVEELIVNILIRSKIF
ncbi:hypothetical protein TIFTF001_025934 [Ficus carica]|uniref:Cytochrome P450 n=1 Tax=Ficus carica TaxID=3494 RepID=A0AA88AJX0_FICCA|nr:hypothetical protein TIFTF001_025934 [Ficus carica]